MWKLKQSYSLCYKKATCWEGELDLLLDNLHSDEVVLLIKAAVVKKQGVSLARSKPGIFKHKKKLNNMMTSGILI